MSALALQSFWNRTGNVLTFIKFSHTIFALPFALISMLVAAQGLPSASIVILILLCMVSARTAAMSFNRWIDWDFDRRNPRTQNRFKLASRFTALALCGASLTIFGASAAALNPLCFALSPVATAIILGYSMSKRFTVWSHAWLGVSLAVAPMGAWAAVTGHFDSPIPFVLAAAVMLWVFGFDLIYATQDIQFDREARLHSIPAKRGIWHALGLARILHVAAWLILGAFGLIAGLSVPYWIGWAAVAAALQYEHRICRDHDLEKINIAFFHANAFVSIVLFTGTALSLWIQP
jgi:4-hydroxybenzoate polyprenyltransferase